MSFINIMTTSLWTDVPQFQANKNVFNLRSLTVQLIVTLKQLDGSAN